MLYLAITSDEQMNAVFESAARAGLNLWDTAAVYGIGSSEDALGKLIRRHPNNSLILSTKFIPQIADENADEPVSAMLEASPQRLGTSSIDIYWIHNPHDVEKWTPVYVTFIFLRNIRERALEDG